jgi:group I intron endonuclease
MIGIYCILNTLTNHRYIGQSVNIASRKSYHFNALSRNQHKNRHLQLAFNRHGPDAFLFLILLTTTQINTLDAHERRLIALFQATNPRHGYNAEPGGLTRPQATPTTKRYMALAQQRRRSHESRTANDQPDIPDHPSTQLDPRDQPDLT